MSLTAEQKISIAEITLSYLAEKSSARDIQELTPKFDELFDLIASKVDASWQSTKQSSN